MKCEKQRAKLSRTFERAWLDPGTAALSASAPCHVEINTWYHLQPICPARPLLELKSSERLSWIREVQGWSRKICEIACSGTGEAFIPQSIVKGSSLTCPCRVRGNLARAYQKVVTNLCLPFKIVKVNAALLASGRNSRNPTCDWVYKLQLIRVWHQSRNISARFPSVFAPPPGHVLAYNGN